jgi:hypothetical protein
MKRISVIRNIALKTKSFIPHPLAQNLQLTVAFAVGCFLVI